MLVLLFESNPMFADFYICKKCFETVDDFVQMLIQMLIRAEKLIPGLSYYSIHYYPAVNNYLPNNIFASYLFGLIFPKSYTI